MRTALLMLACAAIAGCGNTYEHHSEVLAATRDPLFDQWITSNNLEVIGIRSGLGCTLLYIKKNPSQKEGK